MLNQYEVQKVLSSIKNKLILLTLFGVFFSVTESLGIASFLIQTKNLSQKTVRLNSAHSSISDRLNTLIHQIDNSQKQFIKKGSWNFFGSLMDRDPKKSLLLITQ